MTQPQGLTTYRIRDLIAIQKNISGEWIVDYGKGIIKNKRGQEIKGTLNKRTGYIEIKATVNGTEFKMPKHRAIYMCYLGVMGIKIGEELEVNHKDGDKLNNRLENLELVTPSENCLNPNTLMKGEDAPHAKITNEIAEHIRELYISGGFTCRMISDIYGFTSQSVANILHNRTYISESPAALNAAKLIANKPRCKRIEPSEAAA